MIPGLGRRLKDARLATALRLGHTVSQDEMARLVTRELARLKSDITISQSAWSQYENEITEPSTIVYRATANVSGKDEAELAFGLPPEAAPEETTPPPKRRKAGGA